MRIKKYIDNRPLPDSMEVAWERFIEDRRPQSCQDNDFEEFLREVFMQGATSALHQVNAGRLVQTSMFLNTELFRRLKLNPHELIDMVDSLIDGTFDFPPGYAKFLKS